MWSVDPRQESIVSCALPFNSFRYFVICSAVAGLSGTAQLSTVVHAQGRLSASRSIVTCGDSDQLARFITEASRRFDLPEPIIRAVMQVESDCNANSVSPKGALGLMQIMPETWEELRRLYGLGKDPFDARDNVLAGAAYLREMLDRFGAPGFLAAYNTGPTRYGEYLAVDRALPDETVRYLAKLTPVIDDTAFGKLPATVNGASAVAGAPLFVAPVSAGSGAESAAIDHQGELAPAASRRLWDLPGTSLFVSRSYAAIRQ